MRYNTGRIISGRLGLAMNSNTYYLAVDIGASSGRHILGHLDENGARIGLEEVYRFDNGLAKKDGHLCWDLSYLFEQIVEGMKKCGEIGKIPKTMGIDTWAVDFVLLDREDRVLGPAVGYRDDRTKGMDEEVSRFLSQEELYERTGIQKQSFNTIYQLMAVKKEEPQLLSQAESMLMVPDYFHFLLTGRKCTEYTNATTTQLVSPVTKDWDYDLIERLGYPKKIFGAISLPKTPAGHLTEEIKKRVGYDLQVVLPATHDTGSAVVSVPASGNDYLYISSGTWSLMGMERMEADCSRAGMEANLTNEGGYDYRFRYLKNIMGLWMIQSVRNELGRQYSFGQLCDMAEENRQFPSRVDVNDQSFLAPESMMGAISAYCEAHGQIPPRTPGEFAAVIYQSLADSYGQTVRELERITGRRFEKIHIVGGGANAEYLNRLTAKSTQKPVFAGPVEATAIGNLVVQMLADKRFASLDEARQAIYRSFEIKEYR